MKMHICSSLSFCTDISLNVGYKNQHMQKRSCTTLDRGASSGTQPCGRLSWTQWQSSTLHLESREQFFLYNLVTSMAIYLATAHLIDIVCLYDFCQVNFKGFFVFFSVVFSYSLLSSPSLFQLPHQPINI